MKYLLVLLMVACSSTQKSTSIDNLNLTNPESAFYHADSDTIYISNVSGDPAKKDGNGYISKVPRNLGTRETHWVKGLNAPKGLRVYGDFLWAADINQVVKISLSTGKILKKITISDAKMLNDVAIDEKGIVYVSDTFNSAIYRVNKDKYKTFMKGSKLDSPNGLLVKDGMLYVASWGLTTDWSTKTPGRLYSINLKTKKISHITAKPLGNLDGLEFDNNGNFLVSDWVSGKIFRVTTTGDSELVYTGEKGLADIGYIPTENLTIVPSMVSSKLFETKL